MATLTERLVEAEEAYHAVMIGRAPSVIRDANGEEIRYSKADPTALLSYIAQLKNDIAPVAGSICRGPMRVYF
ncbi:gpW family protein [Sphingomonas sp. TREG-RG-20F-R18-01]|uniref:gpW family protein n=1 Tax=Sphingomonas sp. TREG-RG-20F-R18-01 TaxID=2914982 RepID=UPI001F5980BF|nr:gpW family protein [Sphingomonas sp. TREG-RG-20F-R18-01]